MTVLLLALDTSTSAVTVALHDGSSVLAESTVVGDRRHGELLAPGIDEVLSQAGKKPAELTAVVAGVGPGPFTGLRVGVATALAFRAALAIPVYGICSLDAIAWRADVEGEFIVVTDARRREVYWAEYTRRDRRRAATVAGVAKPSVVLAEAAGRPVIGPGAHLVTAQAAHDSAAHDSAGSVGTRDVVLSAGALAEIAVERIRSGGELLQPRPLYLRRPDAVAPGAPKKVLA